MNRSELINKIVDETGYKKSDIHDILCRATYLVAQSLEEGESVSLQNFGTFLPWKQTERPGRNPRTGVSCTIASRTSVKFRPGKKLLEQLNK